MHTSKIWSEAHLSKEKIHFSAKKEKCNESSHEVPTDQNLTHRKRSNSMKPIT